MPLFKIKTSEIFAHFNPLKNGWSGESILREEIMAATAGGVEETRAWNDVKSDFDGNSPESKKFHINRIATLCQTRNKIPIILAIEPLGSPQRVRIFDGKHRFAAAVLMGDEFIEVKVRRDESGDIFELFPSAISLDSPTANDD